MIKVATSAFSNALNIFIGMIPAFYVIPHIANNYGNYGVASWNLFLAYVSIYLLWNVLKGEMSLVGPRPCLFNQTELISERATRAVFGARPGITGLAQVNNIDMSTPKLLAETDARMLQEMTVAAYFKYIFMTVGGKGAGDVVKGK